MAPCRFLVHPGERRDDDEIARLDEMRRRAVDADDAGVGRSCERIGLEPRPLRDVPHAYGLVRDEVGRVHEAAVDGDGALLFDVGLGHRGAMDLGPHHLACHRDSPSGTRTRLSISRTPATHTASASSVGPLTSPTVSSEAGSRSSAYSSRACGSASMHAVAAPSTAATRRSPAATTPAAVVSAAGTQRAAGRAAPRRRLRLERATPSSSRTVGTPTISMPKSRSAVMRRMTASCWKSFSPNTATCGRTAWKSLVTTVVTPRKCPGRAAPQSGALSRSTSTCDWNPSGYIAMGAGA